MTHRRQGLAASLLGIALSGAVYLPAHALPSCAADLASLQGQLHSDHARSAAARTIAATVADAGGIDHAIEKTQAELQQVRDLRALAGSRILPEIAQYLDDAELVASNRLEALNCRRGAQAEH